MRLDNDPSMHVIGEASLQNVKLSTWKHVHEKRNVVYILPRPVVGVSSSEKKHAVRGELADPVWEKKGKCAEKYNNKYEMFSSKTLLSALLALAGLPTQVR